MNQGFHESGVITTLHATVNLIIHNDSFTKLLEHTSLQKSLLCQNRVWYGNHASKPMEAFEVLKQESSEWGLWTVSLQGT
jgi:type IV secretory pathway VirB3-like protein